MLNAKSRIFRKIMKLKRKWETQYPPDQVNMLTLVYFIEKISYYATGINWKIGTIHINDYIEGLILGVDEYIRIVCDHNPSDRITLLNPPYKVRKRIYQKHYLLQILRLASITPWTMLMPQTPEEADIIFPGMIFITQEFSDMIVERIPDDFFSRPDIVAKFIQK